MSDLETHYRGQRSNGLTVCRKPLQSRPPGAVRMEHLSSTFELSEVTCEACWTAATRVHLGLGGAPLCQDGAPIAARTTVHPQLADCPVCLEIDTRIERDVDLMLLAKGEVRTEAIPEAWLERAAARYPGVSVHRRGPNGRCLVLAGAMTAYRYVLRGDALVPADEGTPPWGWGEVDVDTQARWGHQRGWRDHRLAQRAGGRT